MTQILVKTVQLNSLASIFARIALINKILKCPRSVCSAMLEEEVVTLSEDCQNENVDCDGDPYGLKDATLVQQKLDAQEMQRLRDRVEELEIEKVQAEIDIMELEQQVTSLQSKQCDCSSVPKEKEDIKSENKDTKPSVEQCLAVIKAQEEKIGLMVRKIKDWGLDEEKIYEEPKKKKIKTSNEHKESDETEKKNYHKPLDLPPVKRRSNENKTEENKFDIIKRKRRVRFQLDTEDEMDESSNSRKTVKPKVEKVDPHEEFIALHYEFDWSKIPSRLHDVTSSAKLRKVGRKFNPRRSLGPLLKNTFSDKIVPAKIKDLRDDDEKEDEEESEEYFVFKKSPVVKIRKLKRMSLPNFKLDLD